MKQKIICVILLLGVLSLGQLINCTGLCQFSRMFPSRILEDTSLAEDTVVDTIPLCDSDTLNTNCTCNTIRADEPRSCYCLLTVVPMRQCEWFPNDCCQLQQAGIFDSASFTFQTLDFLRMNVSCDMTTDNGGWTIFQRRVNGSVKFDRGWEDYKNGFGTLNLEFWLGNENLHHLTKQKQYMLRIDMITMSGESLHATYDNFTVGGEVGKYRLVSLGEFDGTPGLIDAMSCHESMNFTTNDNDNDCSEENCAILTSSGWWFNGGSDKSACPRSWCKHANLNGLYGTQSNIYNSIVWNTEIGLTSTEMKIRPYNANW